MNEQLFKRIEELFLQKLSIKTGWGRTQIKQIWQEAKLEAMTEQINKA